MAKALHISGDVALGVDYVTKTAAILAQRRKGKTYTASVIAEELVDAGQPWVALDPTGAWWGLRSSADGERPGLPVVILGGQHGDVPLERAAGRYVAELVVENPGWYVIDLSLFESKAAEREFAADFGDALYRRKGQPDRDFPLHLFVDEADMFVPQEREAADTKVLGAFQSIVRRGGLRGLGTTLISQRPALVNKSVLVQLDMLILLRLVAGNDQDYVDKNYVSRAAGKEQRAELMESLASLRIGEAWVWEPGADPLLFARVQIRERRTFNSSATPKPGEQRVEPRRLAAIDLDAVKEAMATTIAKADAEDPKKLRTRIRELERELRERPAAEPVVEVQVERVEVPVLDEDLVLRLEQALQPATGLLAEVQDRLDWDVRQQGEMLEFERKLRDRKDVPRDRTAGSSIDSTTAARSRQDIKRPARRSTPVEATASAAGDVALRAGERKMLEVLASRHPLWVTRAQLGTLSRFKPSGGTFRTYLGVLKKHGLIEEAGKEIRVTDAGLDLVGADVVQPQSTDELLAMWRSALRAGERAMLDELVAIYPDAITRDELGERTGFTASGGTFRTYLGVLKGNGLVDVAGDRVVASDTLFLDGAP